MRYKLERPYGRIFYKLERKRDSKQQKCDQRSVYLKSVEGAFSHGIIFKSFNQKYLYWLDLKPNFSYKIVLFVVQF